MSADKTRSIRFYTCCGRRTLTVDVRLNDLSGEAWRLARCLISTGWREEGVRTQALRSRAEWCRVEGWAHYFARSFGPNSVGGRSEAELETQLRRVYGDAWADGHTVIDWRFEALHIWPNHKNGPHPDPEPETMRLRVLAYLQREAERITLSGGTVIAAGDWSIQLLTPQEVAPFAERMARGGLSATWGEHLVVPPNEQGEAEIERVQRALFGGH